MDTDALYRDQLIEEARNPQNVGSLKNPDVRLKSSNASCGDEVELDIVFTQKEGKQVVKECKWNGTGCIISQSAMSLLSQHIVGKTKTDLQEISLEEVLKWMDMDEISPGRKRCVMLGVNALQQLKNH